MRLILSSVVLSLVLALVGCGAVEPYDEDPCRGQPNDICQLLADGSGNRICGLRFSKSLLNRPGHGPRITIDDYVCEQMCDPGAPRCARGLVCRRAEGYPCSGGICTDANIVFDSCQLPETQ